MQGIIAYHEKAFLIMKSIFLLLSLLVHTASHALSPQEPAAPILAASSWLLYDYTSSQVLVDKDGDTRIEPASLTKLMTVYLTFNALKQGILSLEQQLPVPDEAVRKNNGESSMLLKAGQGVSVKDLLHGLIVQSGNDAAITLSINIAGSEANFADMMNKEAKRLGMTNSHFVNSSGLSALQHYSSGYDLALLASAIIRDHPQFYPIFSIRDYTYNNITQVNRNYLLWLDPYADGLKTGYSQSAGYCIVSSTERNGHRLIAVLFGVTSNILQASESQKLLNFGYRNYDSAKLYEKNQTVTTLRVWKGSDTHIDIGFSKDIFLTIPRGTLKKLQATMETRQPVFAPITNGQKLGVLKLTLAGKPYAEFSLVALNSIQLANVFSRGWDSIRMFFQ